MTPCVDRTPVRDILYIIPFRLAQGHWETEITTLKEISFTADSLRNVKENEETVRVNERTDKIKEKCELDGGTKERHIQMRERERKGGSVQRG